ncbi:MAG: hypothetical protein ABWW69_04440 [Pyrodictiaceae archaeon]
MKRIVARDKVIICGAGVAGSSLAYILTTRLGGKVDLEVYDILKRYLKPCGEAVPTRTLSILSAHGLPEPRILNHIKRFILFDGKEVIRELDVDKPLWVIIDKRDWIEKMRSNINIKGVASRDTCKGREDSLMFDARGPFAASPETTIVATRYYIELEKWPSDTVAFSFLFGRVFGLAWIFPHGAYINAGGGYIGIKNPETYALRYISSMIGSIVGEREVKIVDKRSSLITVKPRVRLVDEKHGIVRVGEAAGLVLSLGGEGIRPAILSAIAASNSLEVGGGKLVFYPGRYKTLLHELIGQVRLHRILVEVFSRTGSKLPKRILKKTPSSILIKWFNGELSTKDVLLLLKKLI